jgi:hypothetical protein
MSLIYETTSNSDVAHDVTQRWRTTRRNDTLAACTMWRNDATHDVSQDVATMWRMTQMRRSDRSERTAL